MLCSVGIIGSSECNVRLEGLKTCTSSVAPVVVFVVIFEMQPLHTL